MDGIFTNWAYWTAWEDSIAPKWLRQIRLLIYFACAGLVCLADPTGSLEDSGSGLQTNGGWRCPQHAKQRNLMNYKIQGQTNKHHEHVSDVPEQMTCCQMVTLLRPTAFPCAGDMAREPNSVVRIRGLHPLYLRQVLALLLHRFASGLGALTGNNSKSRPVSSVDRFSSVKRGFRISTDGFVSG